MLLINLSKIGKFVAYAYLLEVDNDTDNALDTYGVSYDGKMKGESVSWAYGGEFATQSSEAGAGETATDFDASYLNAYVAATLSGVTAKVDYEILGSGLRRWIVRICNAACHAAQIQRLDWSVFGHAWTGLKRS